MFKLQKKYEISVNYNKNKNKNKVKDRQENQKLVSSQISDQKLYV